MNILQKILYELATKNVVPKFVFLNTLGASKSSVYHQLEFASSMNLIREMKCKTYFKGEEHTTDCLMLTSTGVKYIRDNMTNVMPWAQFITLGSDGVSILGTNTSRQRMASRYSKITAAAFMADMIGAKENRIFYVDYNELENEEDDQSTPLAANEQCTRSQNDSMIDDCVFDDEYTFEFEDDESPKTKDVNATQSITTAKTTLSSVISNAMRMYEDEKSKRISAKPAHQSERESKDPALTFYDAVTIKRTIDARKVEQDVQADIRGGRYVGILDSPLRSCLVYTVMPTLPLLWYTQFIKRELRALQIVRRLNIGFDHPDSSDNGILLVSDTNTFEQTYNSHMYVSRSRRRRGSNEQQNTIPECGDQLTNFWVVPIERGREQELYSIMTTDIQKERESIADKLISTGNYESNKINTRVSYELFPLRDTFGTLYAIEPHLNVKRMKAIQKMIETFPSHNAIEYSLLCCSWQIPYYEAVMHDISLLPLDDEIPGYTSEHKTAPIKMQIEKEASIWKQLNK